MGAIKFTFLVVLLVFGIVEYSFVSNGAKLIQNVPRNARIVVENKLEPLVLDTMHWQYP